MAVCAYELALRNFGEDDALAAVAAHGQRADVTDLVNPRKMVLFHRSRKGKASPVLARPVAFEFVVPSAELLLTLLGLREANRACTAVILTVVLLPAGLAPGLVAIPR